MRQKALMSWLGSCYFPQMRALSLMRIGVGLALLLDLLIRFTDLKALYCDGGVWPLQMATQFGWHQGYWSLHILNGSTEWITALFVVHILAALSLISGYNTRIASVLCWLLTVSLQNRNIYILQSGDDLLRITLFWGMLLPWNKHYSVDARLGRTVFMPSKWAFVGFLILQASVYAFTVLLKSGEEWRSDGNAVYYALSLEQIRLPYSGDWLYGHPSAMRAITWLVLVLEMAIPVLILWPSRSGKPRIIAFLCIVALHLGIASTLYVGLFPIISIATAIGILPDSFIQRFLRGHRSAVHLKRSVGFRRLTAAISIVAAIFCLDINMQGLPQIGYELNGEAMTVANFLRLEQYWGMFSPGVMKTDGWFVYQGVDTKGQYYDLHFNKAEVSFDKPEHIVSMYPNDRWRKLAENMQNGNCNFLRPLYAKFILNRWNEKHPEHPMVMLNLYFVEKTNLANYAKPSMQTFLYCIADGK